MFSVVVIGGGLSGLATAYLLKQRRPEWAVSVFEKEDLAGGKVRTSEIEGYTFDWGPNGFVTNAPETLHLALSLGLKDQLQAAAEAAKRRYLYKNGGLRPLPASPPQLLGSELLSPYAKLRLALEPFLSRPPKGEEGVHTFLKRHFGAEIAETFAQVAVSGVTAGDARRLSLDALFPRLRRLERDHGSLIRGLVRAQRQAEQRGRSGRLTSFKQGGVYTLITALQKALGASLETGQGVCGLARSKGGYQLSFNSGYRVRADAVVLATPAYVSARLLEPFLPDLAQSLASIPYADVSVIGLGYDRIDVPHPLDGFGFLAAPGEGLRCLGVLFSSALFPGRAPPGKVTLRVICGGVLDPGFAELSEAEALASVRRDLRLSMGVVALPETYQLARWSRGIPQYELGHRGKVAGIMRGLTPGLYLTGNAYHGVGLNDCVRDAHRVVNLLTEG